MPGGPRGQPPGCRADLRRRAIVIDPVGQRRGVVPRAHRERFDRPGPGRRQRLPRRCRRRPRAAGSGRPRAASRPRAAERVERRVLEPRADRRERARRMGFAFAEIAGEPYWDETACYRFTAGRDRRAGGRDRRDRAPVRAQAVDHAVRARPERPARHPRRRLADRRSGPGRRGSHPSTAGSTCAATAPGRRSCWNTTPTRRPRCSRPAWCSGNGCEMRTATGARHDQFNSIHETLIEAWRAHGPAGRRCISAAPRDSDEDTRHGRLPARHRDPGRARRRRFLDMDEIGWNGASFPTSTNARSRRCSSSIPGTGCCASSSAPTSRRRATRWIEPAWRLVPSSKAFLSLLWHMFPDHPNLLAALSGAGADRRAGALEADLGAGGVERRRARAWRPTGPMPTSRASGRPICRIAGASTGGTR